MNCPDCGKPAIFKRGQEVECINGHIWRTRSEPDSDYVPAPR